MTCYYQEPDDEKGKRLTNEELTLSNLFWVKQNTMSSRPNLRSYDDDIIASEVKIYQDLGGRSIVDCTINGIKPNPASLKRISERTGAHVIAGSGYYIYLSHPPDMDSKSTEDIEEEIVQNVTEGIDRVRCGLIGELKCTPAQEDPESSRRYFGTASFRRQALRMLVATSKDSGPAFACIPASRASLTTKIHPELTPRTSRTAH